MPEEKSNKTNTSVNKDTKQASSQPSYHGGQVAGRIGNGVMNTMKSGVDAASTPTQTGDEAADEVGSSMANDKSNISNSINNAQNMYRNGQNFRKALNNQKSKGKSASQGGAGGGNLPAAGGKSGAPATPTAANGAGAAKTGAKAGRAAGKATITAVKGAAKGILALLANPGTVIVVVVVIAVGIVLGATFFQIRHDDDQVRGGNYSAEYTDEDESAIKETWMGVFYQQYSDMSVWAQVDTTSITGDGNKDVCPDTGNGSYKQAGGDDGIDACSAESFKDLSGTNVKDINQDKLYQEGTKDWSDLNISDIDNKEEYLGLSAGALSVLDNNLNEGYLNPGQFVKPVYASCIYDLENSSDKTKSKLNFEKCVIQKTDSKTGKAQEIEDAKTRNTNYISESDDPSLYLTYAKSTYFETGDNALKKASQDKNNPDKTPVEASTADKEEAAPVTDQQVNGQWDYGLGTLAHYKAVFEPSRISGYHIKQTEYICDGNDKTSSGASLSSCKGKKFGDVVVDSSPSESDLTSAYPAAYVPASEIYYRDWHKNAATYIKNGDKHGMVYTSTSSGEYPSMGITNKNDWKMEPGLSTGVPQTEVKYVIDKAITMGGVVNFNVSQDWITEGKTQHTQYIATSLENTNLGPVTKAFPALGGANKDQVSGYTITPNLYYNGNVVSSNDAVPIDFSSGYKLHWVEPKKEIKQSNMNPETSKKAADAAGECYTYKVEVKVGTSNGGSTGNVTGTTSQSENEKKKKVTAYATVPGHYEDDSGNIYWKGSVHGKNTDNDVLKKVPTGENKDAYTWGAKVSANITVEKEGDLQIYAVKYNTGTPAMVDNTKMAYLKQYLSDYQTYVDDPGNKDNNSDQDYGSLSCYATGKAHTKDDLEDFQKMKDLEIGQALSTYRYSINTDGGEAEKIAATNEQFDDINTICLSDQSYDTAESLHLDDIPVGQLNSMAGKMGFTKDDNLNPDDAITPVANHLKADVGQTADTNMASTLSKTDAQGQTVADIASTYASQYGVDPTLMALIIAQENSKNSNATGAQPGTYTAYNIASRAMTTKEYGGGSQSVDKNADVGSFLSSWWSSIKKAASGFWNAVFGGGSTIAVQGKETIKVTKSQLENGAMLSGSSSSLQDIDPSVLGNLQASTDTVENAKTLYKGLKAAGFNNAGIAGILGNFYQESRFDCGVIETQGHHPEWSNDEAGNFGLTHTRGIGFGQWTGGRAKALADYATSKGKQWSDPAVQIAFLVDEGAHTDCINRMKSSYTDPQKAADDFLQHWEIPANLAAEQQRRLPYAQYWYSKIEDGTIGSPDGSSNDSTATDGANADIDSVINNINNKDYHWDPSDPRYGLKPTESGETLLSTITDADQKLTTVDIYPMNPLQTGNGGYSDGTIITSGKGLPTRTMLMVSNGKQHKDQTVKNATINTEWTNAGDGYSPMSVKLTGNLWIQTMPYQKQSRDSLTASTYQHLIDRKPMAKDEFYVQLKDMIYIAAHATNQTKFVIHFDDSTSDAPDAVTEASKSTVSKERLRSSSSVNTSGSMMTVFTPQALSVKVAAMKLQGLQVKYDYNIPMVITAYGLGDKFMDAVLKVYAQQAGVDRDTAVESRYNTAWADYRQEVYNNQKKYNVTVPKGRSYDYAEKVLSRLPQGSTLSYQQIDLRYDKSDKQIKAMTDKEIEDNNNHQHTLGIWDPFSMYDDIADSNSSLSGNRAALVARGMRSLKKYDGKDYLDEKTWRYLTNGLIKYPDGSYDLTNPSSYWTENTSYRQLAPNIDDSTVDQIITDMMRFGTDAEMGEDDYDSDEFEQAQLAKMFGTSTHKWSSSIDWMKVFGVKDASQIEYAAPTVKGSVKIRNFGYTTDNYSSRVYHPYVTYQDYGAIGKPQGKQQADIYSAFKGKVVSVGKNGEGRFVVIEVNDKKAPKPIQLEYDLLGKVTVNKGDQVTMATKIGKTAKDGTYGVCIKVGGEPQDFETLRLKLEYQKSDAGGGSGLPASISSVKALEDYAKSWSSNNVSDPIWAKCIADSQGGRNFTLYKGGSTHQCTDFAHWVFWMQYGTDWAGGGNGVDCARNIVNTFNASNGRRTPTGNYFEISKKPAAGAIFSWNNHVGYVSKVDGDKIWICDGNVSGYSPNTPNYFHPINTSGIRIDFQMSLSDLTGKHPDIYYAIPKK